jgi:hypothetical protein
MNEELIKGIMPSTVSDADFSDWQVRNVWDERIQAAQFIAIEQLNAFLALIDPADIVSVIPFSMGPAGERYLVSYRQHRLHKNFHSGGQG